MILFIDTLNPIDADTRITRVNTVAVGALAACVATMLQIWEIRTTLSSPRLNSNWMCRLGIIELYHLQTDIFLENKVYIGECLLFSKEHVVQTATKTNILVPCFLSQVRKPHLITHVSSCVSCFTCVSPVLNQTKHKGNLYTIRMQCFKRIRIVHIYMMVPKLYDCPKNVGMQSPESA